MTINEAKKQIICVIKNSTETEMEITEKTSLFDEMGLSSLEMFVMLGELEDTFNIDIPTLKLRTVRTVGDLCQLVISILTNV